MTDNRHIDDMVTKRAIDDILVDGHVVRLNDRSDAKHVTLSKHADMLLSDELQDLFDTFGDVTVLKGSSRRHGLKLIIEVTDQ